MNTRIWGIIGGVVLVLALLSPLVLGSAQKVERLFEAAEALSERSDYEGAIEKYKAALKESKKLGAKTERIDKDFTTLANLKIAQCYYELAENSSDDRHYQSALTHIKKVESKAQVPKHQEELTYLCAEILYKTGDLNQADSKFSRLVEKFPNSRWVPKALYTIGDINARQENDDEALRSFQKLVNEFPHSEFKEKAEEHIAKLLPPDHPDPPRPDPDGQDKALLDEASDSKQQDKVHDAYQLYTDLITQFPDSKYVTDAYVAKAEIHLEAEDYVNARANYEEAMYSTDDEEQKIEIYKKYQLTYLVPVYADETRQHSSSDELFVKARLFRKEERWLEAAEIYEQLANSDLSAEDTVEALYWAGRCYHKAALTDPNLLNKSVNAFKRFIGNYSNRMHTIEAYYYLTLVYVDWAQKSGNRSKWQPVIDTVEEANRRYTDSGEVRNRGWLSRMQELKERAIQELDNSSDPEPVPDPEPIPGPEPLPEMVYVDQGYIHLGRGELEEATKKARQALNIDPNYQRAHQLSSAIKETYYGRGWTFFDEEQYNRAIAEFRNAINIDSDFKEAHCHLGVIYIEQERYTEAIKALKEAINIDEKFKEAHFNLALAHLELGEFEDATNAANDALEIDPNYEPARMLIEFIAD
jgi:tetratricopeptide (TPR) repeat protein